MSANCSKNKHPKYLFFSLALHLFLLVIIFLLYTPPETTKEDIQIPTVEIVLNKENIPTALGQGEEKKQQIDSKSKSDEEEEENMDSKIEDMNFDAATTSPLLQKEEIFQIEKAPSFIASAALTQKLPLTTKKFSGARLRDILTQYASRKKRGKPLESSAKVSSQGANGNLKVPSLFGAKVTGGNIILTIDISPSVDLARAKIQLVKVCKSLLKKQKFNLIAFADKPKAWKRKLVVANKKNKKRAIRWIKNLRAKDGTNIYRAMKKAFSIVNKTREKHVFYLISDGYSVRTKNYPLGFLKVISKWNKRKQMIIHTIGVGRQNHYFLKNLAWENLGEYFPQEKF